MRPWYTCTAALLLFTRPWARLVNRKLLSTTRSFQVKQLPGPPRAMAEMELATATQGAEPDVETFEQLVQAALQGDQEEDAKYARKVHPSPSSSPRARAHEAHLPRGCGTRPVSVRAMAAAAAAAAAARARVRLRPPRDS